MLQRPLSVRALALAILTASCFIAKSAHGLATSLDKAFEAQLAIPPPEPENTEQDLPPNRELLGQALFPGRWCRGKVYFHFQEVPLDRNGTSKKSIWARDPMDCGQKAALEGALHAMYDPSGDPDARCTFFSDFLGCSNLFSRPSRPIQTGNRPQIICLFCLPNKPKPADSNTTATLGTTLEAAPTSEEKFFVVPTGLPKAHPPGPPSPITQKNSTSRTPSPLPVENKTVEANQEQENSVASQIVRLGGIDESKLPTAIVDKSKIEDRIADVIGGAAQQQRSQIASTKSAKNATASAENVSTILPNNASTEHPSNGSKNATSTSTLLSTKSTGKAATTSKDSEFDLDLELLDPQNQTTSAEIQLTTKAINASAQKSALEANKSSPANETFPTTSLSKVANSTLKNTTEPLSQNATTTPEPDVSAKTTAAANQQQKQSPSATTTKAAVDPVQQSNLLDLINVLPVRDGDKAVIQAELLKSLRLGAIDTASKKAENATLTTAALQQLPKQQFSIDAKGVFIPTQTSQPAAATTELPKTTTTDASDDFIPLPKLVTGQKTVSNASQPFSSGFPLPIVLSGSRKQTSAERSGAPQRLVTPSKAAADRFLDRAAAEAFLEVPEPSTAPAAADSSASFASKFENPKQQPEPSNSTAKTTVTAPAQLSNATTSAPKRNTTNSTAIPETTKSSKNDSDSVTKSPNSAQQKPTTQDVQEDSLVLADEQEPKQKPLSATIEPGVVSTNKTTPSNSDKQKSTTAAASLVTTALPELNKREIEANVSDSTENTTLTTAASPASKIRTITFDLSKQGQQSVSLTTTAATSLPQQSSNVSEPLLTTAIVSLGQQAKQSRSEATSAKPVTFLTKAVTRVQNQAKQNSTGTTSSQKASSNNKTKKGSSSSESAEESFELIPISRNKPANNRTRDNIDPFLLGINRPCQGEVYFQEHSFSQKDNGRLIRLLAAEDGAACAKHAYLEGAHHAVFDPFAIADERCSLFAEYLQCDQSINAVKRSNLFGKVIITCLFCIHDRQRQIANS